MQLLGKSLRSLLISKTLYATCCSTVNSRRSYASQMETASMSFDKFDTGNTDANAAPLVIMHGLFGSKQNWRGIGKALASKTNRTIYTVDARNHGDSPHTNTHNSLGMTEDVAAFLKANGLNKACLLGHSMGGRTMMLFSMLHPEMTERLIVVDISPIHIPRTFYEMNAIFNAMLAMNAPSTIPMAEGRKLVREQMMQATSSLETVDFIMLNLRKHPQTGVFYWACNVPLLQQSLPDFDDFETQLQQLTPYPGPTTFLCGSKSKFMRHEHWPKILRYYPNATIHWFDSGHLVHFEQPQKFLQTVVDFLKA